MAKDHGWPVPSYSTVYAVVRALNPALVVLAHEGTKRYREVYDLIHRREAEGPNVICQADHTQLDLWVIAPSGRPARPRPRRTPPSRGLGRGVVPRGDWWIRWTFAERSALARGRWLSPPHASRITDRWAGRGK
ncbi:hypothetical protein GCM10020000_77800 [Streptomyces olivoverticillatus]